MTIDAIARNKAEALIREQLVNTIQQDVPKAPPSCSWAPALPI